MSVRKCWFVCAAVGLLLAWGSAARAETINLVDYRYNGGLFATENSITELFETRENGKLASFWARVTVTSISTGQKTVSVKHLPIFRLKEIKQSLKKVRNYRKRIVYNAIGLCDAPSRTVRFKENTQSVISICGSSAGNLKKVNEHMTFAIGKLGQMTQEIRDLADTTYVVPGN